MKGIDCSCMLLGQLYHVALFFGVLRRFLELPDKIMVTPTLKAFQETSDQCVGRGSISGPFFVEKRGN